MTRPSWTFTAIRSTRPGTIERQCLARRQTINPVHRPIRRIAAPKPGYNSIQVIQRAEIVAELITEAGEAIAEGQSLTEGLAHILGGDCEFKAAGNVVAIAGLEKGFIDGDGEQARNAGADATCEGGGWRPVGGGDHC